MSTGICGWFGRASHEPATVLQAMAGVTTGGVLHTDSASGLFVDAAYEGGVFSDGRMRAAVAGEPTWSDPTLASLAVRSSHAAALADAFRRHRTELFRFLHGPFAFAIYDEAEDESLLAIDRFGVHALCHSVAAGIQVFGASADSVGRHPDVTSTIDPQAIFNYVNFAVVPAPGTIYREQKLDAREHNVSPDEAAGVLETLARAYDEPFGNSSAIPTFCCARVAAKNGVSVLLAGDGGDELFAGNSRYRAQLALDRYFALPSLLREGLIEPVVGALPEALLVGPVRKARNYVRLVTTPMPDRMLSYEHLGAAEMQEMFQPAFLRAVETDQPMAIARAAYGRARTDDVLQRMMHLALELALADNDLRKVRQMCRAAGVKVRFPFLDEDLAAFSAQLPAAVLMEGMRLRGFYKQAMQGFLPPEILDKKKHGFGMPYDLWIRSNPRVRQLVGDSVTSFKRRAYCNPAFIDGLLARHNSDDARYAGRLWDIMILEMWLRERGLP